MARGEGAIRCASGPDHAEVTHSEFNGAPFGHSWGVVVHGCIGNTALLFRAFDWTRGSRERSFFSDGVAARIRVVRR